MKTSKALFPALALVALLPVAYLVLEGRHPAASAPLALPAIDATHHAQRRSPATPMPEVQVSRVPAPPTPIHRESVREQLAGNNDWKAMFDGLDAMTNVPIGERLRFKAVILDSCSRFASASASERAQLPAAIQNSSIADLKSFIAGLMKDARQMRAMEFNLDRRISNVCRGFAGWSISKDDIRAAYAQAAAVGDPVAQARMIELRLADSAVANANSLPDQYAAFAGQSQTPVGLPRPVTPDEQQVLMDALFSEDPMAVRQVGAIFSLGTDQQSFRFGPNQTELGPYPAETWELAACSFGFECGLANMYVSTACAEAGQCADDFAQYLQRYAMTPAEFEIVQRSAAAITDAIRRHDYSAFRLVANSGHRTTLMAGPSPIAVR